MGDAAQTLDYLSPKGERVALTPDQVATFEKLGYRPEDVESRAAAAYAKQTEEQYGGAAETARTFGERALSGATLGASDLLFRGLGVDAEDMASRAAANPIAAGLGTAAGVVGTSLVGGALGAGEAAQAARGLSYTGSELAAIRGAESLGTAGRLVGLSPAARLSALTERIAASGAERGVLGKAATQAAGYGIEGAIFNSGQYLSDVVLQNKELSGEAFVAAMEGGLFGAGLGGGLSLLGSATRAGSDAIAGLLGKKAEKLLQKADEAVPDTTLAKLTPKAERTPQAVARAESNAETAIAAQHTKVDNLLADTDNLLARVTDARTRSAGDALDRQLDEIVGSAESRIATEGNAQYAELEKRAAALRESKAKVQAWQDKIRKTAQVPDDEFVAKGAYGKFGPTRDNIVGFPEVSRAPSSFKTLAKKGDDLKIFREGVEALADYERTSFRTAEAFLDVLDNAPSIAATAGQSAGRIAEDFAPYLDAVAREVGDQAQGPGASALFNGIKPNAKQSERIAKDQLRAEAKAAKEADRAAKAELRQNIKIEKETARAEARAAKASAAPESKGFSIGGLDAGDFMAANELVGFAGVDLRDVPVIGPALSAWLVASRLKGRLGSVGKLVSKATGGPLVGVAEKAAALRNRLADVAQAGVRTAKKVERLPTAIALKAPLYEGAGKPIRPLPVPARSGSEALVAYNERAQEIREAVANPDAVRDRLLHQYPVQDPALFESIYDVTMRRLNYAYDKLPIGGDEPDVYGDTVDPSPVDLEFYGQVHDALQRPVDAMEQLLSGEVLPHVADAVKNVYPSLYAEAQDMVLDEIAKDPASVPYDRRVTLSLIFDLTADRTMRPDYLARVQAAGGEAAQAEVAQPVPGISAPTRLGAAEQSVAARVAGGLA